MPAKFTNNATTTLAAGIGAGATSFTVATSDGAKFPTLSGNDYFYVTLAGVNGLEIVKVTARATDVFTIVRAQDSTTAKVYSLGETVELRPVAAVMNADALLPDQTGNSGKLLTTNGSASSWAALSTTGTGSYALSDSPTFTTQMTAPTIITSNSTVSMRNSVDNASVFIYGGGSGADSASIFLFGKTSASTGAFQINAQNGGTLSPLKGRPTGELTWGNSLWSLWHAGNMTFTDKTSFAPAPFASGGGSFTTVTSAGEYCQVGHVVFFRVDIVLTAIGTGTGTLAFNLPIATSATLAGGGGTLSGIFFGREYGTTATVCQGVPNPSAVAVSVYTYNGGVFLTNGWKLFMEGYYFV